MAKGKGKGSRKKAKKSIPIAIAAPLAYVAVKQIGQPIMKQDWNLLSINMTGYNPEAQSFNKQELLQTYGPVAIGVGIHKLANWSGLNVTIRNATKGWFSF